jgi:glutathione S-transferase
MIKIYHAKRARSARLIWLLEELNVPYELALLDFKPEALRSSEHMARHPLGQLPVMEVDGVRFFESGAHLQFLLERFGQGRLEPALESPERPLYLQWFHFGEASLAVHISQIVRQRFGRPAEELNQGALEESRRNFIAAARVVEQELQDKPFICGTELTAADFMIAYGLIMSRIVRELPDELSNIAAYLERLKQRPSYAKAWG